MTFPIRGAAKSAVRLAARASRPAIVIAAPHIARARSRVNGLQIFTADAWNADFDQALEELPAPPTCTRDEYRELLTPTRVPKRHALVMKAGAPLALISLRRRATYWEPVAYQALPRFVAPARDMAALGVAMNSLGLDVRLDAGLGPEAHEIGARHVYSYNVNAIDLGSDFEAYWKNGADGLSRFVKKARQRTAKMAVVVDGEGDLEWAVEQWRAQWADHPDQEIVAADDRLKFWRAVGRTPETPGKIKLHAITLHDGDRRVAGVVHSRVGDDLLLQVSTRVDDPELNRAGIGTRVLEASVQWARDQGYAKLDFGGGGYKGRWGPPAGVRYGVQFRSRLLNLLHRLGVCLLIPVTFMLAQGPGGSAKEAEAVESAASAQPDPRLKRRVTHRA